MEASVISGTMNEHDASFRSKTRRHKKGRPATTTHLDLGMVWGDTIPNETMWCRKTLVDMDFDLGAEGRIRRVLGKQARGRGEA